MENIGGEAFYRSMFEHANDAIVVFGYDGVIVTVNDACKELIGLTPQEVIVTNFVDYVHPQDVERALYTVDQINRYRYGLSNGSYRLKHQDGTWIPVDVTAGYATKDDRQFLVVHCRFSATPQMEREVLLGLLGRSDLTQTMAPVLDSIARQELGSHMAIAWPAAVGWHHVDTGLPTELCGSTDREPWHTVARTGISVITTNLEGLGDKERNAATALGLNAYWIEPVPTFGVGRHALVTIWTRQGRAEPLIHEFGMSTAKSYVGVILQFTAQRQLLDHAAFHDPLTGLKNRKALVDAIGNIAQGSVLFCDLDHFKPVNDGFGHALGDDLLLLVAERLRGCVRNDDVVARIGGDEFVIVCPSIDGLETERLAQRIVDALHRPFTVDGHRIDIGVSIGMARDDDLNADAIIRADHAMYQAKAAGRGVWRWADSAN